MFNKLNKIKICLSRVIMTEAYGSTDQLMAYYGTSYEPGAHFTFNFNFILTLNSDSSALDFKNVINEWMFKMPKGGTPNWVVSWLIMMTS